MILLNIFTLKVRDLPSGSVDKAQEPCLSPGPHLLIPAALSLLRVVTVLSSILFELCMKYMRAELHAPVLQHESFVVSTCMYSSGVESFISPFCPGIFLADVVSWYEARTC